MVLDGNFNFLIISHKISNELLELILYNNLITQGDPNYAETFEKKYRDDCDIHRYFSNKF